MKPFSSADIGANSLLIGLGITTFCASVFLMPMGPDARSGPSHEAGLAGREFAFNASGVAASSAAAASQRANGVQLAAVAIRDRLTPSEAALALNQVERLAPAALKKRAERKPAPQAPVESPAPRPAPAETVKPPAENQVADPFSADSAREAYEGNLAKYRLGEAAVSGGVTLRLVGLVRAGNRYVLRVSVNNDGRDDFFVKRLVALEGDAALNSRSFFDLFVQIGKTVDGFVVFDRPRPGASVHILIEEDREKGRVIKAPVRFLF